MAPTRSTRAAVLALAATLSLAACGDDDGSGVRDVTPEGEDGGSGSGSGSGSQGGSGSGSHAESGSPAE